MGAGSGRQRLPHNHRPTASGRGAAVTTAPLRRQQHRAASPRALAPLRVPSTGAVPPLRRTTAARLRHGQRWGAGGESAPVTRMASGQHQLGHARTRLAARQKGGACADAPPRRTCAPRVHGGRTGDARPGHWSKSLGRATISLHFALKRGTIGGPTVSGRAVEVDRRACSVKSDHPTESRKKRHHKYYTAMKLKTAE